MRVNDFIAKGVERLQQRLKVAELQAQYRAYGERLVPLHILDVSMEPVGLRVKGGKVEMVTLHPLFVQVLKQGPPYPKVPWEAAAQRIENYVVFKTLATFLDVVTQRPLPPHGKPYTVQMVWGYSGCRMVRTYSGSKWNRYVFFDGDMAVSAAILQRIMQDYLSALKQVLDEMGAVKFAIVTIAGAKQFFAGDHGDTTFKTEVRA